MRREAAPGTHATKRFKSAAVWLRTLLRPPGRMKGIIPLEQLILQHVPDISKEAPAIQADASPWGGGAVLFINRRPVEYLVVTWTPTMARKFKTKLGDPSGQTSWEYLMLF